MKLMQELTVNSGLLCCCLRQGVQVCQGLPKSRQLIEGRQAQHSVSMTLLKAYLELCVKEAHKALHRAMLQDVQGEGCLNTAHQR